MKNGCLEPEEIIIAMQANADDSRRLHLEQCPWCQALRASLDLFQSDTDLPVGSDLASAEKDLDDFLQREIVGQDSHRTATLSPDRFAGQRRFRLRLIPTVWAAAAVIVVVVGLSVYRGPGSYVPVGFNLRSEGGRSTPISLRLTAPELQPDGSIQVVWSSIESATGYTLILLDGEQREADRITAGVATGLSLEFGDIEALKGRPEPWFIVVTALSDDDEIARSLPRLLPVSEVERIR